MLKKITFIESPVAFVKLAKKKEKFSFIKNTLGMMRMIQHVEKIRISDKKLKFEISQIKRKRMK